MSNKDLELEVGVEVTDATEELETVAVSLEADGTVNLAIPESSENLEEIDNYADALLAGKEGRSGVVRDLPTIATIMHQALHAGNVPAGIVISALAHAVKEIIILDDGSLQLMYKEDLQMLSPITPEQDQPADTVH